MPIDPNVLLKGVSPDPIKSARQGFDFGTAIRNAPLLRKQKEQALAAGERQVGLDEQRLATGERVAQSDRLKRGQNEALAAFNLFGDRVVDESNFEQTLNAAEARGIKISDAQRVPSPENIAMFNQTIQAGGQLARGVRGSDKFGRVTSGVDSEGKEIFFQTSDQGETRVLEGVSPKVKPKAVVPDQLLEGLSTDVANKASAAFTAGGGGKAGLDAFAKTLDKASEQERRSSSASILKQNFPNASAAEMSQLQAGMDASKTVQEGIKSAGKVRVEQKRSKKAQAFQDRAVNLIGNILANDELSDVLGSVEGAIDFRASDSESELIQDIEEATNILTADNMDLMTGVLSESDIKLLKNLSSGGLNRKRTEARFRKDAKSIIDKLSSVKVETTDERAEKLSANDPSAESLTSSQGVKFTVKR